jgi:hypothetical protein
VLSTICGLCFVYSVGSNVAYYLLYVAYVLLIGWQQCYVLATICGLCFDYSVGSNAARYLLYVAYVLFIVLAAMLRIIYYMWLVFCL